MNLSNKVLINSDHVCYLVLGKSTPKNLYYLQELKTNRFCQVNCTELDRSVRTGKVRIVSENLKPANKEKVVSVTKENSKPNFPRIPKLRH